MLGRDQAPGVEERRQALEGLGRALAGGAECERGRSQEVGDGEEVVVALGVVDRVGANTAELGHTGQRLARPALAGGRQHVEPALDVVEHVEDHARLRRRVAGERGPLGRLEQHLERALAGHERIELGGEQRA